MDFRILLGFDEAQLMSCRTSSVIRQVTDSGGRVCSAGYSGGSGLGRGVRQPVGEPEIGEKRGELLVGRVRTQVVQRGEYVAEVGEQVEAQVTAGADEGVVRGRTLAANHQPASADAMTVLLDRRCRPPHKQNNRLFIGGDGGLPSAAVLLSVVASAKRHGLNPWAYLRDVLTRLPARPPDSELPDLLPDRWKLSDSSTPAARIAG